MDKASVFNTVTMAKMHAEQGHLEKAVEIYSYLIEKEPGREDLKEALLSIEKEQAEERPDHSKRNDKLVSLFSQWFDLTLQYNKLQKLKKLHIRQ